MTWDELKEKAKEMGYNTFTSVNHKWGEWVATPDNDWSFDIGGTVMYDGLVLALDRTPEQMLMIMKGLE